MDAMADMEGLLAVLLLADYADDPLQQDEARQRTLRRERAQGRAWGGRVNKTSF